MKKVIRLTESDLINLVKRILKESDFEDDDTSIEDIPDFDDKDYKDNEDGDDRYIEDYGFDIVDTDDDDFESRMRFKERMRKNKLGNIGMGYRERWSKDMEKPYSPIKPDDLPLDKFLKSKYNK